MGPGNMLYALDRGNNRVVILDTDMNYQNQHDAEGDGDHVFAYPQGIAVASSGDMYVKHKQDSPGESGVVIWDSQGVFLTELVDVTYDDQPLFLVDFSDLSALYIDASDYIYFINSSAGLGRLTKTDLSLGFSYQLGGAGGAEPGEFNEAMAITVDSSGNIYIADSGNHRIQRFSLAVDRGTKQIPFSQ
jgi:tripartite motif-containing protein 71